MRSEAKARRSYWVSELAKLSGCFGDDCTRVVAELQQELALHGIPALLDHLRLCGAVPESYGHDSSEEKLYSKYTDAVISEAFSAMGLRSLVMTERADAADVQAHAGGYSLVADAKAFRLSRTAKNQKDFKVQALDGWRNDLDFAAVVCPIHQLPARTSQIYQQAIARNVCILSYSHLAVLVRLADTVDHEAAESALHEVLKRVSVLRPSKSAADYWFGINGTLLLSLGSATRLWTEEKRESLDALQVAKDEGLAYLAAERDRLLGLSHQEALAELVRSSGLESRIVQVERAEMGSLLDA